MITWIGLCAGEIRRYLDAHEGEGTLGARVSEIDAPRETILMAVGCGLRRAMAWRKKDRFKMRMTWSTTFPL